MYARLSRFGGLDPERIGETVQQFETQALPGLEQQQGFRGITAGVDPSSGRAFAVTLWDTQEDMKASEQMAQAARDQAVETGQPDRDPIVDHYEVVVQRPEAG